MAEVLILELGGFKVYDMGSWRQVEGQTAKRNNSKGEAYEFRVTKGRTVDLVVGEVLWENRDREVKVLETGKSPEGFQRLGHGLRLGVDRLTKGQAMCEVRVALLKEGAWSNMFQTNLVEMRELIGSPLPTFLKKFGATHVGTKADLLGETGTKRNELCVIFDDDDSYVPAVTFFLTRILPISKNWRV